MVGNTRLIKFLTLTLALTLVLAGIIPALAQDDSMMEPDYATVENRDPLADAIYGEAQNATIQSVTTDSNDYYGMVVTLEGNVGEFVNARSFALGEDAAIDNDLVLVLNNSNNAFKPEIVTEAWVRVTGRVHPSIVAVNEGAQTDFGALFNDEDDSLFVPTDQQQPAQRVDMLNFYYDGWLPNGYDNYTVIEVMNVNTVEFVELDQSETGN